MNKILALLSLVASVGVVVFSLSSLPQTAQAGNDARIVNAAVAFLDSLDAKQRQRVLYALEDDAQRARGSEFAAGFSASGGTSLKQLSPAQRDAAMKLLAVAQSPMGLEKVDQIR